MNEKLFESSKEKNVATLLVLVYPDNTFNFITQN